MGMYTELVLAVDIRGDAPEQVINVLDWLFNFETRTKENSKPDLPDHPFFRCERLQAFGFCDSAYFPGCPASRFIRDCRELSVRFNLKNYGNEIEFFLDWLHPYVSEKYETFLGYKRYESHDDPTLIYREARTRWRNEGSIKRVNVRLRKVTQALKLPRRHGADCKRAAKNHGIGRATRMKRMFARIAVGIASSGI